jgi:hypothetical protein
MEWPGGHWGADVREQGACMYAHVDMCLPALEGSFTWLLEGCAWCCHLRGGVAAAAVELEG